MMSSIFNNSDIEYEDFQEPKNEQKLKGDFEFSTEELDFPKVEFRIDEVVLKRRNVTIIKDNGRPNTTNNLF